MDVDRSQVSPFETQVNMDPERRLRIALAAAARYEPILTPRERQRLLLNTIRAFVWDGERIGAAPKDILDTLMRETVPAIDEDEWSVY